MPGSEVGDTRILIAEDEPHVSRLLEFVLRSAGYVVDCVGDGADAIARVSATTPDVLLLDLGLPTRTGRDVLRAIAGEHRRPIVIVLTAGIEDHLADDMRNRGADALLAKPVAPTTLISCLASLGAGPRRRGVVA
jgi:CheY-like chemotaxis protein